jgi:uncharacterized protein (TIGR03000 family)
MYTAVLMLAMTTGADSADHGRRGCNGCSGYYGGCSGSSYSGCCSSGYRSGYYGYSYAPGFNYGYASGYGYSYAPGYSYGPGMMPGVEMRQSFYRGPGDNGGAMIRVMVPDPEAEIWFENSPTKQRGMDRLYYSAPFDGTGNFGYTIKAKWMDNGRAVEQERRVQVQRDQPVTVDFRTNPAEKLNLPKTVPEKNVPEKKVPKANPPEGPK